MNNDDSNSVMSHDDDDQSIGTYYNNRSFIFINVCLTLRNCVYFLLDSGKKLGRKPIGEEEDVSNI